MNHFYRSHASFYKVTTTKGQYGNFTESLTLVYLNIPCYCTYLSGYKQVFAGKLNVVATHRLFCDPLSLLNVSYRVYVAEQRQWFNVLYVDNCNQRQHHFEILLEMIDVQNVDIDSSSSSSSHDEHDNSSSSSSDYSKSSSSDSSSSSSSEEV